MQNCQNMTHPNDQAFRQNKSLIWVMSLILSISPSMHHHLSSSVRSSDAEKKSAAAAALKPMWPKKLTSHLKRSPSRQTLESLVVKVRPEEKQMTWAVKWTKTRFNFMEIEQALWHNDLKIIFFFQMATVPKEFWSSCLFEDGNNKRTKMTLTWFLMVHSVWKSPKMSHSSFFYYVTFHQLSHFLMNSKCSSLRSPCWMRLFLWFSNTV